MRKLISIVENAPSVLSVYASAYMRGMGATSHPEAIRHEDEYNWRYEGAYPIANIAPTIDWAAFMDEEIEMWAEDGQPARYEDELTNPIRDPIIIVEVSDGHAEIADGCHRVGACAKTGRSTIPAVVGTLKSPPTPKD